MPRLVAKEDRKVLLGHKTYDVTTHYSAAEIGFLIAATERVCDLAERGSPAIAVVRSSPSGHAVRAPCPRMASTNQAREPDSSSGLPPAATLPVAIRDAAAKLAYADGISLDQFIAAAVAGEVQARRTDVGTISDSPIVAAVRRPGKSVAVGFAEENKGEGSAKGDSVREWMEMRYSRRQTLTAPRFRRAANIRGRSSKFP
jgi:hypothetical protein